MFCDTALFEYSSILVALPFKLITLQTMTIHSDTESNLTVDIKQEDEDSHVENQDPVTEINNEPEVIQVLT